MRNTVSARARNPFRGRGMEPAKTLVSGAARKFLAGERKYWSAFFLGKLLCMAFAFYLVPRFTQLGDTIRYLSCERPPLQGALVSASDFMDVLGWASRHVFGSMFWSNLPFAVISFAGIRYAVHQARLTTRQTILVLVCLSFPSNNIWTSICSKEAVCFAALAVVLGAVIRAVDRGEVRLGFLEAGCLYLVLLFKALYILPLLNFLFFIAVAGFLKLRRGALLACFLVQAACNVAAGYAARGVIQRIASTLPQNFISTSPASSTRPDIVFTSISDFVSFAPQGTIMAFIGPTLPEATAHLSHLAAFCESIILLAPFAVMLLRAVNAMLVRKTVNMVHLAAVVFLIAGLIAVHYPYGVLNPGSALRYRASFWGFLLIFSLYLYNRSGIGGRRSCLADRTCSRVGGDSNG